MASGSIVGDHSGRSLLASVSAYSCGQATAFHAARGNSGCGVRLARDIGGNVIDLAELRYEPLGVINSREPSTLAKRVLPMLMLAAGGILVNQHGNRFCSELDLNCRIVER